ncbi:GNAT family N-acetyltransferase [Kineosporia sp. R_H_3]|uniref:GNAT family N-acetyltransferase n=1 Tax=Kineosporia sp. R_H_3 TaxID=1961848 RepID=UPI001E55AF61|nr:GNAT family protein [Kineosporia sp. R_H_3]
MTATRPLTADDVPALVDLVIANRAFLAPYEPDRGPAWFTEAGQAAAVRDALERADEGVIVPRVVLAPDGSVVGRVNLNNVVRGAFQSCSLGYWLDEGHTGRGLATAAVAEMLVVAFDELGLHRVEAGTLVHNVASQTVLARNGFERFGLAPGYLRIAGRWQDHVLFQRLSPHAG